MYVINKQLETKEKKMIAYPEAQKHARFVRDAIVRNGDLRAALGTMDEPEAASIIKSLKILDRYNLQKQRQPISQAEFQTNAKVVHEAIVRNGDLRVALETMDEPEAASIYKSLRIVNRYKLQMQQLQKQVQK